MFFLETKLTLCGGCSDEQIENIKRKWSYDSGDHAVAFPGAPGSEPDSEALEELNKKGYLILGLGGTSQVKVPKGMFEGQGHSLSDDPACPDKVADLAIDFFK